MKIIFSTYGSLGDIHPYLAVALEAKTRGHQPILATSLKYRVKVEQLGLEFRPIGPDLPSKSEFGQLARQVMDLKDGPRYLFQELLSANVRESYADLLVACEDADLIVTHPAVPAGPLVAQKLGKKWLSSVLAPISLWSKIDPPVPPTLPQLDCLRFLGPLWASIFFQAGKLVTRRWVQEIYDLRAEIGLEPKSHPVFEGQFSPLGTLALFSPLFAAPQRDWPTNTKSTGFCFYDAEGYETTPARSEHNWRQWIEQDKSPIVFALGSSAVWDAEEFWQQSQTEVQRNQARGVFLKGGEETAKRPASILELDYAPYSEIFPLSQLVVHQGGVGTTAQALRAGKPQLVVPYAHDQPDNAARIKRLGVGLNISLKKYKSGQAGRVFNSIYARYAQLSMRAEELGQKIRVENGPKLACEFIEKQL